MDVILSSEAIDLQECDVVATGFFQDERPLQGASGWIDWRLNGMLSRFLIDKRITGSWKETVLIPSEGRTVPRMILLVGLGKMREYSSLRVRELFQHLLNTLKKLEISSLCISFPHGEDYHLDCSKLVRVVMEGMADWIGQGKGEIDVEWAKSLRVYFAEGEEKLPEVLVGLQTARAILQPRMDIRILIPADNKSETTKFE
jgi:hypothetical protein